MKRLLTILLLASLFGCDLTQEKMPDCILLQEQFNASTNFEWQANRLEPSPIDFDSTYYNIVLDSAGFRLRSICE